MAEAKDQSGAWPNEGEGSRSAARAYNKSARDFEKTGAVDQKAHEAAEAVDGPEGEELRKAEEEGKRHSHGEDPLLNVKGGKASGKA
jgi:hypothetical protein